MAEKNFSYLLIGNGRLATHLRFYLQSQNIRVSSWNRKSSTPDDLKRLLDHCDIVLLAIKDGALESFVIEHPELQTKTLVHFSGAMSLPNVEGLHPLMTFTEKLYALDFYKKIPFISETGRRSLRDLFPQLENPTFTLDSKLKPLYHSLCVMGGNFTTLLWKKLFDSFEGQLHLPPEVLFPYLQKISENLRDHHKTALTGPLHRRDVKTIQSNLDALRDDSYFEIYKSFVNATHPDLLKELDNDHS